ncbi:MAG: dihydroneopterin aldolase [Bacteroidota bacterium]
MMPKIHHLAVNKLRIPVFIGVKPQERARAQLIEIDFKVTFQHPPKGCVSDQLEDTVCYADLVKQVIATAQHKEYALLEHLNHTIHQALSRLLEKDIKITLKVAKLTPPIPNIFGGVSYQIQDQ